MGEFDKLYQDTYGAGAQEAITAANPYAEYGGLFNQFANTATAAVLKDPNYGMKEALIASALSGVGSGLFSGLGNNYQATLTDRYNREIAGLRGSDEYLPQSLKTRADNTKLLAAALQAQRQRELFEELQMDFSKAEGGELAKLSGQLKAQRALLSGSDGGGAFLAPGYTEELAARRQVTQDFEKLAKEYRESESGFRAMVKAWHDKGGTSDYELIRRAAQAVEPGLAVRKDDQDSIQQAASLLGETEQTIKAAMTGTTKLTDDVRDGIMRIAQRAVSERAVEYNMARDITKRKAADMNIDPNKVVYYPEATAMDVLTKGVPTSVWQNPTMLGPENPKYVEPESTRGYSNEELLQMYKANK